MGFQVSPGVNVTEIDLTTVVPAVSTTEGAIAGVFRWGPVEQRILVDSEVTLASRFGKPTNANAETFFTAANFLAYGNKLYVSRVLSSGARNADDSGGGNSLIKNEEEWDAGSSSTDANAYVIARYAGELGNALQVEMCFAADAWQEDITIGGGANLNTNTALHTLQFEVGSNTASLVIEGANNTVANADVSTAADAVVAQIQVGSVLKVGNSSIGEQYLEVSAIADDSGDTFANNAGDDAFVMTRSAAVSFTKRYTLSTNFNATTIDKYWKYWDLFDTAPGTTDYVADRGGSNDGIHLVAVDRTGEITGVPGQILEKWESMSRATDAKTEDGSSNYYLDVINSMSNYFYINQAPQASFSNTAANMVAITDADGLANKYTLSAGNDGNGESAISLGDLAKGYDLYQDAAEIDVSLILAGKSRHGTNGTGLLNYLIDNIAEVRKDCVVFGSPQKEDLIGETDPSAKIVEFRNSTTSSSYAVLDSGYKYQYDKYNDIYRWIPLNGDVAGLVVRTDDQRDPWFSPGGFNRGQIKNVVKLAFNPKKAYRDILYKNGINPVVAFPGQGTVLFGDKTLLAKPSAFDRINVRRLFIVLEKAISTAAKFTLFEFNDEFTRAQFVSLVEPFLRDVQGRRGIFDYRVVCDESNNTGEVIDRNEFVGDIYIKPARAINFIQLNFIAVRTGVEFSEVVGKF